MRLVKRLPSGTFELMSVSSDLSLHAILSHTCSEGQEVTYIELVAGREDCLREDSLLQQASCSGRPRGLLGRHLLH